MYAQAPTRTRYTCQLPLHWGPSPHHTNKQYTTQASLNQISWGSSRKSLNPVNPDADKGSSRKSLNPINPDSDKGSSRKSLNPIHPDSDKNSSRKSLNPINPDADKDSSRKSLNPVNPDSDKIQLLPHHMHTGHHIVQLLLCRPAGRLAQATVRCKGQPLRGRKC